MAQGEPEGGRRTLPEPGVGEAPRRSRREALRRGRCGWNRSEAEEEAADKVFLLHLNFAGIRTKAFLLSLS